jgi:hypothetical protein
LAPGFLVITKHSAMRIGRIEYNFNDDKILYVQFTGDIRVENLIDYMTAVGSNSAFTRVLKLPEDRQNGIFNFSIRENISMSRHAYQFVRNYRKVFLAANFLYNRL